jgi:chemotaxis protein MotB
MAFFVLLHSFAEMDLTRFREIANSMRGAFGDQRTMPAPDPIVEPSATTVKEPNIDEPTRGGTTERLLADAQTMALALSEEIREQKVEIHAHSGQIMLRVQEVETFPSGSAELLDEFSPLIKKIRDLLKATDGQIYVAGHTDNVPIATSRYRSNWELSSARAVSVVHRLVETGEIAASRIHVQGHGDTQPIYPNDRDDYRALNRRVEIVVLYGDEAPAGTPAPASTGD